MLLDLSSIKEGIASIKQTLAALGSEGYYKPTMSSNYKIGELPAFSQVITANNDASETRTMGAYYALSPTNAFYPKLNGALGVKVTNPRAYLLLIPYTPLLTSNNWGNYGSTAVLNSPDFLYWFNMRGSGGGNYEQNAYNSTIYNIFTSIRFKMGQGDNEFYIPCIKGLPLIPAIYNISDAAANSYVNITVGFDKIEFFAQEIK